MPVAYRILPHRSLIHVAYSGVARLGETVASARACAADPAFSTDFRHLVDLRAVIDFERDIVGFLAMQAQVIEFFPVVGEGLGNLKVVMIAPPGAPRQMAEQVRRSWDGVGGAILRIAEDEGAALSVLGLPADALADQPVPGRPAGA
jgi:hypothetical protein